MAGVVRGFTPDKFLGRPLNEVERKHAPAQLWASGDESLAQKGVRVSIVGARNSSPEGLRRAHKLAVELVANDVIIVSGLAEGIDTAAHTGAMSADGGKTIAVLGTPLHMAYPKKNEALQHRIMRDHLAVSQFEVGRPVQRHNFPLRNRVMALVSDATVIVEALESSGSIHQGWEAIRLGRPLFLMKSITEDKSLKWPGAMLGYGACVLTKTDDLLEMLPVGVLADQAGFAF